MSFVIDCSVALAWLLPDEDSAASEALADRLVEQPGVVPTLWYLEITNALVMAQRRKRITRRDMDRLLDAALSLPIVADAAGFPELVPAVRALTLRHGITAYDATYLELAQRLSLPLATLDTSLRNAANAVGVTLLP